MLRLKIILGFIAGFVLGAMLLIGNGISDQVASSATALAATPYESIRHWGAETRVSDLLVPAWARLGRGGERADALSHAAARVVWLYDSRGTASGVGIKLTQPGPGHAPLLGRLAASSVWSLFWPGVGSAFAASHENLWPILRDNVRNGTRPSDRNTSESFPVYDLTARSVAGSGIVTGSTGQIAGSSGSFAELADASQARGGSGSLLVKFNED